MRTYYLGERLTVDTGVWVNGPDEFLITWQGSALADVSSDWADIRDAAGDSYRLRIADLKRWVRAKVIAINEFGPSLPAYSEPVGPVSLMGHWAQTPYDDLTPMTWAEQELGYPLAYYINAIGQMMEDMELLIRDDVELGAPGWSQVLDINRCPSFMLPWLAQFVGVDLDLTLSDALQRTQIREEKGRSRGSLAAITNTVKKYLVGAQTVIIRERDLGNPYHFTVITYDSDTQVDWYYYSSLYTGELAYQNLYDDFLTYGLIFEKGVGQSNAIAAALAAMKPGGLLMDYKVLPGQDYQLVFDNLARYADVYLLYDNYQAILDATPASTPFTLTSLVALPDYTAVYNIGPPATYEYIYDNELVY